MSLIFVTILDKFCDSAERVAKHFGDPAVEGSKAEAIKLFIYFLLAFITCPIWMPLSIVDAALRIIWYACVIIYGLLAMGVEKLKSVLKK